MTSERWNLNYLDARHGSVHLTEREVAYLWLLAEARWWAERQRDYDHLALRLPWEAPDGEPASDG